MGEILGRLEDRREAAASLQRTYYCRSADSPSRHKAASGRSTALPFPCSISNFSNSSSRCVFSYLRKGPGCSRSPTLASWEAVKAKVPVRFHGVSAHAYGFQVAPDPPHHLYPSFLPNCLLSGLQAPASGVIQQTYRLLNQFPQLLKVKFLFK